MKRRRFCGTRFRICRWRLSRCQKRCARAEQKPLQVRRPRLRRKRQSQLRNSHKRQQRPSPKANPAKNLRRATARKIPLRGAHAPRVLVSAPPPKQSFSVLSKFPMARAPSLARVRSPNLQPEETSRTYWLDAFEETARRKKENRSNRDRARS